VSRLVRVLVTGLAAWRMARFIAYEDGPYGIMEMIRLYFGAWQDSPTEIGKAMQCRHCSAFWLSAVLWLLYPLTLPVAGSAITSMLLDVEDIAAQATG